MGAIPAPRDQWYVIHVRSGFEQKVRDSMLRRIQTEEMGDYIYEVLVPTERVSEVKKGKMAFRVDKFGIVHAAVGRVSSAPNHLSENAHELVSTLQKMKPSSAKGIYMKTISVASTMSPGIAVDPKSIKV